MECICDQIIHEPISMQIIAYIILIIYVISSVFKD